MPTLNIRIGSDSGFHTGATKIEKMASKPLPAGSKRPLGTINQDLKVKFLINIPLKVDSEDQAKRRCGYLLDALSEGFREKDREIMKENVAVIFGMNGKHTPERAEILKKLQTFSHDCKYCVKYSIITFTWGKDGTIAKDVPEPKPDRPKDCVPYQDIREYLKNHATTMKLVKELQGKVSDCLVYFSFVDSDTVKFNFIYSEYLEIVKAELGKDSIPPTLMSTGYEVNRNSKHHIATWLDRMTRVAVAEVSPLLTYYPEPNFCVLVQDGLNTITESFIKPGRKKDERKMESAVLISQLKKRKKFKAVFSDREPIHIETPDRFQLRDNGMKTGQSTLEGRNLAICAYANGELTNATVYRRQDDDGTSDKCWRGPLPKGIIGINRAFIIDLFKCQDDDEFEKLAKKNPFKINGEVATVLVEAIRAAREYKTAIYEINERLPE